MLVLVEGAAKSRSSSYVQMSDPVRSLDRSGQWVEGAGVRRALVRPVLVVERLELTQGVQEMTLVPDQHAVQQFSPAGLHPPLRDRVHSRHPDTAEHHPDTRGLECLVEQPRKLPVPIPDQTASPQPASSRPITRFFAAWTTQDAVECAVAPRIRIRRFTCSIAANTYKRAPDRVTVSKKPHARSASARERRKPAQVLQARSGAGSMSSSFRISRTADAAILVVPWEVVYGFPPDPGVWPGVGVRFRI